MAKDVVAAVERIAAEILTPPLEIVDVEYVKERDWYLRVFIDKPGGVDLDDLEALSRVLEKELDDNNVISESYILEVSSPGLDRPLKKPRDFFREMGKMVDVSFYAPVDGKKDLTGRLISYDGDAKTITLEDKGEFSLAKISGIKLHIDF